MRKLRHSIWAKNWQTVSNHNDMKCNDDAMNEVKSQSISKDSRSETRMEVVFIGDLNERVPTFVGVS